MYNIIKNKKIIFLSFVFFLSIPFLWIGFDEISKKKKNKLMSSTIVSSFLKSKIDSDLIERKNKEAIEFWTFLQQENRLSDIQKYNIQKKIRIEDGSYISFFKFLNRIPISDFEKKYEFLPSSLKSDIKTFLGFFKFKEKMYSDFLRLIKEAKDIDVALSFLTTNFFKSGSSRFSLMNRYSINKIKEVNIKSLNLDLSVKKKLQNKDLNLLQQQILGELVTLVPNYQKIIDIEIAAFLTWDFLKTNNRLQDLQKYKVKFLEDSGYNLNFLAKINPEINLNNLKDQSFKNSLWTLYNIPNYQNKIIKSIIKAKEKAVWFFLTKNNENLINLQALEVPKINNVNIQTLLDIDISKNKIPEFSDLSSEIKKVLINLNDLENYQGEILKIIEKTKVQKPVWNYIKQTIGNNLNRLLLFWIYEIKNIGGVDIFLLSSKKIEIDNYFDLTAKQKSILSQLSQLSKWQRTIQDVITKAKNNIAQDIWNLLKTNDHLKNIQKYYINSINAVSLKLLHNIDDRKTSYFDLNSEQKEVLTSLFENDLQKSIFGVALDIENAIQYNFLAFTVWAFLQEKKRLLSLQEFKIKKIDNINISNLWKTPSDLEYKMLNSEERKILYDLSQLKNYQNKIDVKKENSFKLFHFFKDFQASGFLHKIKNYKLKKVENINLESFYQVPNSEKYYNLNPEQKENVISLYQAKNYKNLINQKISNSQKEKDQKALWIGIGTGILIFIFSFSIFLYFGFRKKYFLTFSQNGKKLTIKFVKQNLLLSKKIEIFLGNSFLFFSKTKQKIVKSFCFLLEKIKKFLSKK